MFCLIQSLSEIIIINTQIRGQERDMCLKNPCIQQKKKR